MTIKVSVRGRSNTSGIIDDLGECEFLVMPREGETVMIDGVEGEIQRIEHLIVPGKPPEVVVFIDR